MLLLSPVDSHSKFTAVIKGSYFTLVWISALGIGMPNIRLLWPTFNHLCIYTGAKQCKQIKIMRWPKFSNLCIFHFVSSRISEFIPVCMSFTWNWMFALTCMLHWPDVVPEHSFDTRWICIVLMYSYIMGCVWCKKKRRMLGMSNKLRFEWIYNSSCSDI